MPVAAIGFDVVWSGVVTDRRARYVSCKRCAAERCRYFVQIVSNALDGACFPSAGKDYLQGSADHSRVTKVSRQVKPCALRIHWLFMFVFWGCCSLLSSWVYLAHRLASCTLSLSLPNGACSYLRCFVRLSLSSLCALDLVLALDSLCAHFLSRALACVSSCLSWMLLGKQLEEQGNSLPKLEEGLKLALSDRDKYISLLEQLKTYKQNLQEKIEKKIEEDRLLKVFLDTCTLVGTNVQR